MLRILFPQSSKHFDKINMACRHIDIGELLYTGVNLIQHALTP